MEDRKGISVSMILLLLVVVVAVVWWFHEVIVYILISAALAFIGRPLVRQICRIHIKKFRIPRWLASSFTLLLFWVVIGGLVAVVVPLVAGKAAELSTLNFRSALMVVEEPIEKVQNYITSILPLPTNENFSILDIVADDLNKKLNFETFNSVLSSIANMGKTALIASFSISFITFFFLKEDGLFTEMVAALFPEKYATNVYNAVDKATQLLSRYFTGLVLESSIIMTIIAVVLLLFGMDTSNALIIAVLMGLLNVIPYAGPAVGFLISIFLGVFNPIEGCTIAYTITLIVCTIAAVKALDDLVLQPYIYSSKVQAHPLEIFIVILMGGFAGGMIGLLVAVPSYTVLRVFAKEFFSEVSLVRKLTKEI